LPEHLHRLTAVLSRADRVTITLEQMRQELTHAKFVIDYQDISHSLRDHFPFIT
jgi:hypothetical protein